MKWSNLRNFVNQNLKERVSQIFRRVNRDDAEKSTRPLRPTITETTTPTRILRPRISEATEFACILIKPHEVLTTAMIWPCQSLKFSYESHRILLSPTLKSLDTELARGFLGDFERSRRIHPRRLLEATEIEGVLNMHREFQTKMIRRAMQVRYKTQWIFMEQLGPRFLEGTEIELRRSNQLLTRRSSLPIEYLGRALIEGMSNKPDDSQGIFMERLLSESRGFCGVEVTKSIRGHPRLETRSDAQGFRRYHKSRSCSGVLTEEAIVGGRLIKFQTGVLSPSKGGSKGAAVVKDGDTSVLGTICFAKKANTPFKLMADYREDPSTRCETLGWRGRFFFTSWERLTGDLILQSVTPLLRPQRGITIQVCGTALSVPGDRYSDVTALNAASGAVTVSNIPWGGPFGAVRVGKLLGLLIVDPSPYDKCEYVLTYVATRTQDLIVEFESSYEIPVEERKKCIKLAKSQVINLIAAQDRMRYRNSQK